MMLRFNSFSFLLTILGIVGTCNAWAQSPQVDTDGDVRNRPLSAANLMAIRQIGQVVSLSHNAQQGSANQAHNIRLLQSDLDDLIAEEADGDSEKSNRQVQKAEEKSSRREGLRHKVRESLTRWKAEADDTAREGRDEKKSDSPILAMARERANILQKWTEQMNERVGEDKSDRIARLRELRKVIELSPVAATEINYVNSTPFVRMAAPPRLIKP